MRSDRMTRGQLPASAADVEDNKAYFLGGTYLGDTNGDDNDIDGEAYIEAHGCLPRLRVWTAGLLHPRRHSRGLSCAGLHDFHYNPLH